jgi:hypothetical protein
VTVQSYNGGANRIPLAPPLVVSIFRSLIAPQQLNSTKLTLDDLFDLSPFMVLGKNTIRIIENTDMSQFVYCLRAHHPTQAQQSQLALKRRKEGEWDEELKNMCRPVALPSPCWKQILDVK